MTLENKAQRIRQNRENLLKDYAYALHKPGTTDDQKKLIRKKMKKLRKALNKEHGDVTELRSPQARLSLLKAHA